MSNKVQCDECKKLISEDDDEFNKWYSIQDYGGADICSKECYEKFVIRKEKELTNE